MQILSERPDISAKSKTSSNLQEKIEEGMMGLFDKVAEDKGNDYREHRENLPTASNLASIIKGYANHNAAISGAAGLVPGPLGMVAAFPEIMLVIKNQVEMIYDIGVAYGYEKKIDGALLASVFAFSLGSGALGLIAIHGQKVLVKRASLKLMQKFVHMMAGKISQRVLKSMIGKWIPIAGAFALAAWSKYSTQEIAKRAVSIFEKEISFSEEAVDYISTNTKDDVSIQQDISIESFDLIKIQTLINLMKIDGVAAAVEQEYISLLIKNVDLSDSEKLDLVEQMDQSAKFKIDYSQMLQFPDDTIGLLADMIGLAKRDGAIHVSEKIYIKQVAKILGFSDSDVIELMAV